MFISHDLAFYSWPFERLTERDIFRINDDGVDKLSAQYKLTSADQKETDITKCDKVRGKKSEFSGENVDGPSKNFLNSVIFRCDTHQ